MLRIFTAALVAGILLVGCDASGPQVTESADADAVFMANRANTGNKTDIGGSPASGADRAAFVRAKLQEVNDGLAARGSSFRVAKVEWVTKGDAQEAGQTVFAHDRLLRLPYQWVPADPRRDAAGNEVTHVVAKANALANGAIDSEPAIDAAFQTWNEVRCSNLDVQKVADPQTTSLSLVLDIVFGIPSILVSDIATVGFLPGVLFDFILGPGASQSVLGVTFGFLFVDENGDLTDINNDGYLDLGFSEIWYNDEFAWSTDGSPNTFDIETVALHENGHGLGLGHFGKVSITNANGFLHVSPRAVMNAFILGTLRTPLGTDSGAICSLYASWPS